MADKPAMDISVRSKADISRWLKLVPEINLMASIEPEFLVSDQADITSSVWEKLAGLIKKKISRVDGLVVTHNLDNILFTSSMMAYIFQNLGKPIVFTGAQLLPEFGLKGNLINAVQVATMNLSEVCLMFGNRLIRATRAVRDDYGSLNSFSADDAGLIGKVDFGVSLQPGVSQNKSRPLKFKNKTDNKVLVTSFYPGSDCRLIEKISRQQRGLFILNDNLSLPGEIEKLADKLATDNIPVVLFNPAGRPAVSTDGNIIKLAGWTYPAALTKFFWVLGQTKQLKQIKNLMLTNLAGEFD